MPLTTPRFAKILATIGPASRSPDNLRLLHDVGVTAFRLNFSHGSHADHEKAILAIRTIQEETGRPICIIADMQGPKIRCGTFKGGHIDLSYHQVVDIQFGEHSETESLIFVPHKEVFEISKVGDRLKFDDGKLQVTITESDGIRLKARVDVPGSLSDKKGLNVIDAVLPMSAMTKKDEIDISFALKSGVDYIALSFVQTAQDVLEAKAIIGDKAGIVVKLEKPAAIENLDAILHQADAAMVARGDLGVELPLEDVPIAQRRIISRCRALGKPVIVATHMLESMIEAPTPTRAEASDVASAIYQGADVVMLSAETAVGQHPATAVAIMDRIIRAVEADPDYWTAIQAQSNQALGNTQQAVGSAIAELSKTSNCRAVFGYTLSGSTACRISRERPQCRIVALTPEKSTACRVVLAWGVEAYISADPKGFDEMAVSVQAIAKQDVGLKSGDSIIVAAGIPFGQTGATNTLQITKIR